MIEMLYKWFILAAVGCGTFMATLDSSIVNIALPTLTKDLAQDLYRVKWVVMIYLLINTCLILPLGKISDHYGRKFVFLLGFFVFILSSALCGFAPHLFWLVFFRGIQALGAAMLMANGPAIITASFVASERGMALGVLSMVVSIGLLTGPVLGGILMSDFGWRSIFWLNIPVGLIGIGLTYYFVPKDFTKKAKKKKSTFHFDWIGSITLMLFLVCFILLFESSYRFLSKERLIFVLFVLGVCFYLLESRSKHPLFQFNLLSNSTFLKANAANFFSLCAFSSLFVIMPFFLEEVLKFSTFEAGLFMSIIPITIFITAPLSGIFSDRHGTLGVSLLGNAVGIIALLFMSGVFGSGLTASTSRLEMILSLVVIGFSMGLFQSPNNSAIMGCVPHAQLGSASAILVTFRNLGLVVGTSFATSLFTWRMAASGDFILSFHTVLLRSGFTAIIALIISMSRHKVRNKK